MKKIPIMLALVINACADTASAEIQFLLPGNHQDNSMLIRQQYQQQQYQQQQLQNQQEMLRLQREANQRQNREYWDNQMTQPLRDYGIYRGN